MAYRKFVFRDLESNFGLIQKQKKLFSAINPQSSSDWLEETLRIGKTNPLVSEKAVGENLISPILTEMRLKNDDKISLFSGVNLVGDKKKGLNGECDFILAQSPHSLELKSPIISITEAKKGDVTDTKSLAQCSAQLLGARLFNGKSQKHTPILYGCVSSGFEWRFLQLEQNTIWVDTERYSLKNLPELLGILQHVIDFFKP